LAAAKLRPAWRRPGFRLEQPVLRPVGIPRQGRRPVDHQRTLRPRGCHPPSYLL